MNTQVTKYVSLSNDELIEEAFKYAQTFVTMWGYFPHSMHWNVTKLGAPCAINRLHQIFGSYYSFKNWCYRRGLRVDNNTRKGWVIHALRGAQIDPHLLNTKYNFTEMCRFVQANAMFLVSVATYDSSLIFDPMLILVIYSYIDQ